jgi:hypothetical protein
LAFAIAEVFAIPDCATTIDRLSCAALCSRAVAPPLIQRCQLRLILFCCQEPDCSKNRQHDESFT